MELPYKTKIESDEWYFIRYHFALNITHNFASFAPVVQTSKYEQKMVLVLILFAIVILIVVVILKSKRVKSINIIDRKMTVKEEIILLSVHCVVGQNGLYYDSDSIIKLASGYEFDFLVYGQKHYLTVYHNGNYLKLQSRVFGQKKVWADMTEAEFRKSFKQSARDIQSDNSYTQSLFYEEGYRTLHYEDPDTGDMGIFYFKKEQLVCFVIFDARAN